MKPGKSKLLKVILLGDGSVGKSSLMNQYVSKKFDAQSFHTIGVEFLNKDCTVGDETYTMQIWDTAGQERFRSLRTPFYRGADCCLLTFSVDDLQSFRNLPMWRREFFYYADIPDNVEFPFVVIGNKIDIEDHQVTDEQVQAWCVSNGNMPYFMTSARDNINVERSFLAAVQRLKDVEDRMDCRPGDSEVIKLHRNAKSTSCC